MRSGCGFGFARRRRGGVTGGGATVGGIPAPSGAARFLNSGDGSGAPVTAPIIGQVLFIDPGPFTNAPTSYDYQVYSAGVAIPGETGTWNAGDPPPYYLVPDDQLGNALSVKCHGINGSGTSATTSDSAATTAVADIDLTNAITAYSRTSLSGDNTAAFGLQLSLSFGPNVYEGYYLRAIAYSDSGLSTLTQSARIQLTHDLLQPGADPTPALLAAGFTKLGATDWLTMGVEATTPDGHGRSFTFATAISPTDAAIATIWSAAHKDPSVALSAGNLTAAWAGGGSASGNVYSNNGFTAGKDYIEHHVTSVGGAFIAVVDGAVDLTADWSPTLESPGADVTTAAIYNKFGQTDHDGAFQVGGDAFADGDDVDQAIDFGAKKVWWRVNNGPWFPAGNPAAGTGGLSISAMTGAMYPGLRVATASITTNFGATPYTRAAPAGFGPA